MKTTQMTLVLTEQAIYIGKENFAQWPLPKVQELPRRDELKPPFSHVHRKEINDVEQIVSINIGSVCLGSHVMGHVMGHVMVCGDSYQYSIPH